MIRGLALFLLLTAVVSSACVADEPVTISSMIQQYRSLDDAKEKTELARKIYQGWEVNQGYSREVLAHLFRKEMESGVPVDLAYMLSGLWWRLQGESKELSPETKQFVFSSAG